MNNTILVTGGAGYIGSHFCKYAKQQGYNIIVYDNLSTGRQEFVKWGELIVGDLNNYILLNDTLKKYNPIAIVHFAASIEVGESVTNPYKYYLNNVFNTLNLLKAMVENNIKNIIFSSTAAIFGISKDSIIKEDTEQNPINPYGQSKLMVEKILEDFRRAYNINYTALRYFNASGADPDCELGETHKPANHLISIVLEGYKLNKTIKVFGGDWNTKDGTCIRDYIHVYDLATAHILALKKMLETKQSKKINLGIGKGFTVLEIIKIAEFIVNDKIKYEITNRRDGDPECVICDNNLAKTYLNWNIKYSDVKEHIKHTWNWLNK